MMLFAGVTATKIRAGLYQTDVRCRCGGMVWVEKDGHDPSFLWESFCKKCGTCDANGHPSLRDCMATATKYFNEGAA